MPQSGDTKAGAAVFEAKCIGCGKCEEDCYAGARRIVGTEYTIDRLMELLRQCIAQGIHTAVETAACVAYSHIEPCLPYIDLIFCDVKVMDNALHRRVAPLSGI